MSYYKLIAGDQITDAIENPAWVKESANGLIVRCDVSEASGVISSDGERVLHLSGRPAFHGEYEEVALADMTDEEYQELKTILGLGGSVDSEQAVEWPVEEQPEENLPEDETLSEVKARKLAQLKQACRETICAGVDVELSDGSTQHFELEIEDQLNLISLSRLVDAGAEQVPYHASGELCTYYSAEDLKRIVAAANQWKIYHTTYYNSLKNWVLSMRSIAKIGAVAYGDEIPEKYRSVVLDAQAAEKR
jgi:hypothetical protein